MRTITDISYTQNQDVLSKVKSWLNENDLIKKMVHRVLVPKNQAEPRWFVKPFINPFFHTIHRSARLKKSARMDVFPFNYFEVGDRKSVV